MIARVFPRKTAMSPTDALAFFGPPTIENIADCIKAGVTEIHISVTFTWDLEKAEDLYYVTDRDAAWLPWESADPLLVSEVLRSMSALAEKMS